MKGRLLILLLLLFSNFIYSQKQIDRETREYIDKIVQSYKPKDSTVIFYTLDSIYNNTKIASNKPYALFALAISYHLSDKKDKYSEYLLKAEREALKIDDYYTLIDVYDAISHNYSQLQLFSQALKYNEKCIEYINKIDNKKDFIVTAKIRQMEILLKMNNLKDIPSVIDELNVLLNQAEPSINYISHKSKFLYLQGEYYFKLEKFDLALRFFQEYFQFIEKNKNIIDIQYYNVLVHSKIGLCLIKLNRLDEVLEHIHKVEKLLNKNSKIELYNYYFLLHEYYSKIGNDVNKKIYAEKLQELKKKYSASESKIIDEHLNHQLLVSEPSFSWYKVIVNLFFLSVIIDFAYYLIIRISKKSSSQTELIPYVVKPVLLSDENCISGYLIHDNKEYDKTNKEFVANQNKFKLSTEIVDSIKEKLIQFEKSDLYLKKNYTISNLSSDVKVNTKYLNYVFKNDLQTDFSTYINTLKIQYILKFLETNVEAKSYKLSFLAELAGFSSHSKFTQIFKQVVGTSPSVYVSKL